MSWQLELSFVVSLKLQSSEKLDFLLMMYFMSLTYVHFSEIFCKQELLYCLDIEIIVLTCAVDFNAVMSCALWSY